MNMQAWSARAAVAGLLALVCWMWPMRPAQAAVNCSATMTNLSFGNVDLVLGTGMSTNATLNYTCTNDTTTATFARVCFNIGDGDQSLSFFNPRRMNNLLQFQMYHNNGATIWGSNGNSQVPNPYTVDIKIPAKSGSTNGQVTGNTAMKGTILGGQAATPPGAYQNQYSTVHTTISWTSSTSAAPVACGSQVVQPGFIFAVTATVVKSCTVVAGTASDILLGTVASTATNVAGNKSITVTCAGSTPYFIGLAPSNGDTTGAGQMKGTGTNTDKVPYQLRSTTGTAGTIWGNTATSTAVGNGVTGTGTGAAQSIPVYVTVPSANFTPDSYTDTVTVNVNY